MLVSALAFTVLFWTQTGVQVIMTLAQQRQKWGLFLMNARVMVGKRNRFYTTFYFQVFVH